MVHITKIFTALLITVTSVTAAMMGQSSSKSSEQTTSSSALNVDSSDVEEAVFGAGCYWGTEKYFKKDFAKVFNKGAIVSGKVGFMGPSTAKANPSYPEVCSGSTGHVEVYNCKYTGGLETYEALTRFFFQFHDPTTLNSQGNDTGTQYASVIYAYNEDQFSTANKVIQDLQKALDGNKLHGAYQNKKVMTDVRMATTFYEAHAEHQEYLENNPGGYCNHRIRFKQWPQ